MNLQEQINDKTVAISVKTAKLTARMLQRAIQAFLRKQKEPHYKRGEQSVRSLGKDGSSITDIPIDGDNIAAFRRIARQKRVDFSLKRDSSTTPPTWTVFFKAKDAKAMDAAFNAFAKIPLKHKTRKRSLEERLAECKKRAKTAEAPVKNRHRGERELG